MKLTAFLMLTGLLHAGAAGLAQKVTIQAERLPLVNVFKEVEQQTGCYFVYSNDLTAHQYLVTLHLENVPVQDALAQLFRQLPYTWTMIDKVIVIKAPEQAARDTVPVQRNTLRAIRGRVTSVNNEPLINTSVVATHSKTAATTDANGFFDIKVDTQDQLAFSYTGYKSHTLKLDDRSFYVIKLEVTDNELDKVVIQAYGTTSRRLTTSNIGVVKGEDIEKQPTMSALEALQGKVAGLEITPQNGYASGPVKVEIRGRNVVNPGFTSDPLYIIDGVPLTVLDINGTSNVFGSSNALSYGMDQTHMLPTGGINPLFSLNPADIASVEVLKDADATAIYGSRGANGVILITTKKGHAGKSSLATSASQGVSFVTRTWDMLNTQDYLAMRREAFANDGLTPTAISGAGYAPDLFSDTTRYTDWQKYLWGHAGHWTNVQSSLTGGDAQTSFRLAAGYNKSTDITTASGSDQRMSFSANITNHSANKRFTTSLSASYTYTFSDIISMGGTASLPPNAPAVFDSAGNLNFAAWKAFGLTLPFSSMLAPYNSKTNFLTTSLDLSYTITRSLAAKVNVGYNRSENDITRFTPIASKDPNSSTPPTGSARWGTSKTGNWVVEPQLEYNNKIGAGQFNALVGGTLQNNSTQSLQLMGDGYTNDDLLHTITNALTIKAIDNNGKYKYAGVFARVGYRLFDRYILNLNGRRDGSSRFGPGKRFGNFGSVGAAWILSDEKWITQVLPQAVSFVKIRGSYGITGSDAVGDYQYVSQWGNSSPLLGAYNGVASLAAQIQPNANFHWQVNRKMELALDVSFLKDHINLELAYYKNRCNNQLVSYPTPVFTGFTSVTANSPADVQNTGWEFMANAQLVNTKKISWSVDFNIAANRNKLIAYPKLDQSPYYNRYTVGKSLNLSYYYHYLGIDPLTGKYSYEDWNHDGVIKSDGSVFPGTEDDDRYVAIDLSPKFFGGMTQHFRFKNWQLDAAFTFKKQQGIVAYSSAVGSMKNISQWQFEHRWQHPGDIAEAPGFTTTGATEQLTISSSDGKWTDASFVRLRTINLSYSFPKELVKKAGMSNLSFSVSAQNIFVITGYAGLDPEVYDFGRLPPARTITAGLSCTF